MIERIGAAIFLPIVLLAHLWLFKYLGDLAELILDLLHLPS